MALWANSVINSNVTASLFNQLFNRKFISYARQKNGLLYAILGKSEAGSAAMPGVDFKNYNKISGNKIELRLHNALATYSPVTDGANEIASVTPQYANNKFGGAVFDLCHYAEVEGIPGSEMERIEGDEAKTLSYIDDVMQNIMLSLEDNIGTSINSNTNNPARDQMGSWVYALDDGSTYASYGTIDRSDSANAKARAGYLNATTGALTLAKISLARNTVTSAGGTIKVGVCGTAVFSKIEQLVQANIVAQYDGGEWSEFGGTQVMYGGIRFILDDRAPANTLALLDPSTWAFYRKDIHFTKSGIVVDPSKRNMYALPWSVWAQLICTRPLSNAKLSGIDA